MEQNRIYRQKYILKCVECGKEYSFNETRYLCPKCEKKQKPFHPLRGVLEIINEVKHVNKENCEPLSFLPLQIKNIINYPVGNTALIKCERLCEEFNFKKIFVKDDGKNPTNSLKDRASLLVVADAMERGETQIVTASTGNAASSLAGICAYTGLEAIIFVPSSAPKGKLIQICNYGARIVPIEGSYDETFELSIQYSKQTNICNRSTAYNPMTTEGKKTVAIEIFNDLGNKVPDIVFVPVGDGSIISGVVKGFKDLVIFNLSQKLPIIIGVQAEGSDSIYQGFDSEMPLVLDKVNTIADSISVSAPRNGIRAIKDIKDCNGYCIRVSDNEILNAQYTLGKLCGVFAEPAASTSLAGFMKVKNEINNNQTIVLISTGDGLKDIDSASKNISIPKAIKPSLDSIFSFLKG